MNHLEAATHIYWVSLASISGITDTFAPSDARRNLRDLAARTDLLGSLARKRCASFDGIKLYQGGDDVA